MLKNCVLLLSSICFALVAQAAPPCPSVVRIAFPDYAIPPFFNGQGDAFDNPPGYLVEWVRQAMQRSACDSELVLTRRPTKRMYLEVEQDQVDIIALTIWGPEREPLLAFPRHKGAIDQRQAFYTSDASLWILKSNRSIHWDGKTLTGPPGFTVGSPAGSAQSSVARAHGWNVEEATTLPIVIEKLLLGRTAVALSTVGPVAALAPERQALLKRLSPAVTSTLYFSPSSHGFYAKYPEFTHRFWHELCVVARADKRVQREKPLPACS